MRWTLAVCREISEKYWEWKNIKNPVSPYENVNINKTEWYDVQKT